MDDQAFVVQKPGPLPALSHGSGSGMPQTPGPGPRALKASGLLSLGAVLGATASLAQGRGRKTLKGRSVPRHVLKKVVEVPEVTESLALLILTVFLSSLRSVSWHGILAF